MASTQITVNVYGVKNVQETLQVAAMLVDEFAAIPQTQLMHVIEAARDRLPDLCARLDLWLDHLDEVTDAIQALKVNESETKTEA